MHLYSKVFAVVSVISALMTGCVMEGNYAPVTDIHATETIPKTGAHTVSRGETLYSIAWRYGFDYRQMVAQNHIQSPYAIHAGQKLIFPQKIKAKAMDIIKQPAISSIPESVPKESAGQMLWVWPAKGKIINNFGGLSKGIDIAGTVGEPIYAAAAGKVVYSGNGLRGYGNLIIIKHNNVYLSAYAHNWINLVREGESVGKGQKIAEMGNTGTGKTILHFEIRRAGLPIDPLGYYHFRGKFTI